MKQFFFLMLVTVIFYSCSGNHKDTEAVMDETQVSEEEKDKVSLDSIEQMDPVLVLRYFSGNLHNSSKFPCLLYNKQQNRMIVCGKDLVSDEKSDDVDAAWKKYMQVLDNQGFFEENHLLKGKEAIIKDGKKYYHMTMDELLPKLKPEEEALYTPFQRDALYTSRVDSVYKRVRKHGAFEMVYCNSKTFFVMRDGKTDEISLSKQDSCFKVVKELFGLTR